MGSMMKVVAAAARLHRQGEGGNFSMFNAVSAVCADCNIIMRLQGYRDIGGSDANSPSAFNEHTVPVQQPQHSAALLDKRRLRDGLLFGRLFMYAVESQQVMK